MYNVVTTADSRFFPFAVGLVQTLRHTPDVRLFVYDLGLSASEKQELSRLGVTVERVDIPEDAFAMNSASNIRAVHKPNCIEHFLRTYQQGMILLDADIVLLEPSVLTVLTPAPDELVVTYRCRRENKPHILINGKINTGVTAYGANLSPAFFNAWRELCRDPEYTDQSALSFYLEENGVDWGQLDATQPCGPLRVRVLDGEVYNDTSCRVGQIFHFKSAGRRMSKFIWYRLFVLLMRMAPGMMRRVVRLNKQHGLFIWNKKQA